MANQFPGLLRTHFCGELDISHLDSMVKLCGWMNKYRDLEDLFYRPKRQARRYSAALKIGLKMGRCRHL